MCDFLKSRHRELWDWFASTEAQSDYAEAVQFELLKTTYRMDREKHENLYRLVDEALQLLELDVPVTLYQAQETGRTSAALYFTPGHGHLVFVGGILKLLDQDEQRALVGHELAHFKLWTISNSDFLVTDRLLQTLANEPRATPGHLESARLWQLYTEVYADRGAAQMASEGHAAVSLLVKVSTGLEDVDAESYLKQAEDIFAKGPVKAEGFTHPETYIRARAISLWSAEEDDCEASIEEMIEGSTGFDELDLLDQERMTDITQRMVNYLLRHDWIRTGRIKTHANYFFPKGMEPAVVTSEQILTDWQGADEKARDYGCYLLLDFGWADRDLEEYAMAASFLTAEELGWADRLEELARKELKLLKRDTARIRANAEKMVKQAEVENRKATTSE
ncbi:hypothetical protein NT6N_21150 [Oceaniferula spumae]|uniref:Peptidase M48 domain-containing protein n=1 Tax=Oceaniferula spumae TaxID=2979115 RepID=A0AAT9FM32_9BACT